MTACQRHMVERASGVQVLRSMERPRARYAGLQRCGSVWTCPVCAARITEHRRAEVAAALDTHTRAGGTCLMVTLTHSHGRADDLATLLQGERDAHARMSSWRSYKALVARVGRIGSIRAREMTYGRAHGWHPHTHEVWLIDRALTAAEIRAVRADLYTMWHRACAAVGLPAPSETHGVDVRVAWSAEEYLAKWARDSKWGTGCELTKAHTKRGRADRWTPHDLLRDTSLPPEHARALWVDYAGATHGARQLTWSRGLKALMRVEEITDEQIVARRDEAHLHVATISPADWRRVLRADARAQVLETAERGGAPAVRALLDSLDRSTPPETRMAESYTPSNDDLTPDEIAELKAVAEMYAEMHGAGRTWELLSDHIEAHIESALPRVACESEPAVGIIEAAARQYARPMDEPKNVEGHFVDWARDVVTWRHGGRTGLTRDSVYDAAWNDEVEALLPHPAINKDD